MAPTPASAHATIGPTENQCDCTATPSSPVAGSRATIEKVWTGRNGSASPLEPSAGSCDVEGMRVVNNRNVAKTRISFSIPPDLRNAASRNKRIERRVAKDPKRKNDEEKRVDVRSR